MNVGKILTTAGGILGAGFVLYDSHKTGVMVSQQNIKEKIGGRLPDQYIRSRRQEDMSFIRSNLRNRIFRDRANMSFPDKINAVTGYLKGAFNQLASNIVPALLVTGTLVKNKFNKQFGIGLGIYAAYYVLDNIFDWGRIKHFRD